MSQSAKRLTNPYYGYGIVYLSENFHRWERAKGPRYRDYRRAWAQRVARLEHGDFPLNLNIEVTTRCNLACTFCTQPSLAPDQVGDMPWDLFTQVVDEAAHLRTPAANFNGLGEPMLLRDLPQMIRYAKSRGFVDLMFHTNATIMTEERARAVIDSGLDRVIFSVDSPDKATYEAMRINARFERVVANVRRFAEIRNRLGRGEPIIRMTMVVTEKTVEQVQDFVELWRPIADQLTLQDLTWRTKLMDNGEWVNREKSAVTVDFGAIRKEAIRRGLRFACPYLYQSTYPFWNGDIIPCSNPNARRHMVMGRVDRESLQEIWRGPAYRELRDLHSRGRWYEHPICRDCEIPLVELAKGLAEEGVTFDAAGRPVALGQAVGTSRPDARLASTLAPGGVQPADMVLEFEKQLSVTSPATVGDPPAD